MQMSNARLSILQARAVKDKRISDSQFRTLAALGMYADEDGWCFPSLSTLGDDLSKSKQAVGRDTIALRKLGYLEVKARFDASGARRSSMYRLKFDLPPRQRYVDAPSTSEVDAPSTSEVDVNDPINDPINDGAGAPLKTDELPIEWQIAGKVEKVVMPDETHAKRMDFANLVAIGTRNPSVAYAIAMAFQVARNIILPESKVKGQRKAVKEMLEMGVQGIHVRDATRQLMEKNMTVTDLFSVSKTAIDLANKPAEPPKTETKRAQPQFDSAGRLINA
jgi:hypothetical protein